MDNVRLLCMMSQLNNKLEKAGVEGAPTVEDEKQIYVELINELSRQLKKATKANEKKSEFDDNEQELLEELGNTYNRLCIYLHKLKGIEGMDAVLTEFNNDIINYNNALKETWDEETLRCGGDRGGRKRRRKSRRRKKKSKRRRKRRRRTKKKRRRRR